jgi:hypothetical protein
LDDRIREVRWDEMAGLVRAIFQKTRGGKCKNWHDVQRGRVLLELDIIGVLFLEVLVFPRYYSHLLLEWHGLSNVCAGSNLNDFTKSVDVVQSHLWVFLSFDPILLGLAYRVISGTVDT